MKKIIFILIFFIFSVNINVALTKDCLRPISFYVADAVDITEEYKQDANKTVLDIAKEHFNNISSKLNIPQELLNLLQNPEQEFEVVPEILLDDNSTFYSGRVVRCRHSTLLGPGKGGMRYTTKSKFNINDARGLGFLMPLKTAGAGISLGGAKGEWEVDLSLNQNEIARFTKEGIWQIMDKHQALGEDVDIPAPDIRTGKAIIAYMLEAYLAWKLVYGGGLKNKQAELIIMQDQDISGYLDFYRDDYKRIRKKTTVSGQFIPDTLTLISNKAAELEKQGLIIEELAAFTDKPLDRGGREGREEATGLGGFYAETAVLEHYCQSQGYFSGKESAKDLIHVQRGFGNVGMHYANITYSNGGIFKAVANSISAIKCVAGQEQGIDIKALIDFINKKREEIFTKQVDESAKKDHLMTQQEKDDLWDIIQKTDVDLAEYQQQGVVAIASGEDIIDIEADVLVEAATHGTINKSNAHRVRQKMVLELANAPVTLSAEKILSDKGIIIVPDLLANAGGVIVSMYEMKQNITGVFWPTVLVYSRLEERIRQAVATMFAVKERNPYYNFSNRQAHMAVSVTRLLKALEARMWLSKDPHIFLFLRMQEPIFNSIYTSPQTSEELWFLYASGITAIQNAIDLEEVYRRNNLMRVVAKMRNQFTQNISPAKAKKVCLIGGPTGYKTKIAEHIRDVLRSVYGDNAVVVTVDLADNRSKIKRILNGEEVVVACPPTVENKDATFKKIKLRDDEILILESDFAMANNLLDVISEQADIFSIAADIMPCMNIRIGSVHTILTNDDYTILRELLVNVQQEKHPELFDAFNTVLESIKHRDYAVGEIYATFINRSTTYNSYNPFELLFLRNIAMPYLMQAQAKALEIISLTNKNTPEWKDAQKTHHITNRLLGILNALPDIDVFSQELELAESFEMRQVIPEDKYANRHLPQVPEGLPFESFFIRQDAVSGCA